MQMQRPNTLWSEPGLKVDVPEMRCVLENACSSRKNGTRQSHEVGQISAFLLDLQLAENKVNQLPDQ